MEAHIKTARAHAAISWFYALVCLLACLFPYLAITGDTGIRPAGILLSFAFPAIFLLLFLLHRTIARGARQAKNWARIATIIVGVVSLLGFPVGTIIGVYLLVHSSWQMPSNDAGYET
jgi:hypothetical protein